MEVKFFQTLITKYENITTAIMKCLQFNLLIYGMIGEVAACYIKRPEFRHY